MAQPTIAAASPAIPITQGIEPTPMLRFGFYCFCVFNLAYYSRIFEVKFVYLHIPLITSSIALLGAAMDGRLMSTFSTKIGAFMGALTVLYAVNVPLSTWRSQSLHIFIGEWLKSLIAFMIAGALIVTLKQCRTALNSIGWGVAVTSLLAIYQGRSASGRLEVSDSGTLANPNELAFILLLGLPFLWLMVASKDAPKLKRLAAFAFMLTSLYALMRTGSRAGVIGLCILCVLYFLRAPALGKIAMALTAILAGVWVVSVFPTVAQRYKTIFVGESAVAEAENSQEASEIESAVGSAEGRRKLLVNSIKVTVAHPVTGVGLGAFGAYMAGSETQEGIIPRYQGTHNTYTQVSAEAGIPALGCFLAVIVLSFHGLRQAYKRAKRSPTEAGMQAANVSFALIAALTAYSVCVFFDFVAYSATLPVLAGFALALRDAAGNALDAAESSTGANGAAAATIILPPPRARAPQLAATYNRSAG